MYVDCKVASHETAIYTCERIRVIYTCMLMLQCTMQNTHVFFYRKKGGVHAVT